MDIKSCWFCRYHQNGYCSLQDKEVLKENTCKDFMQQTIIAIAIPTYGGIDSNFFTFYHDFLRELHSHQMYYFKLHTHGDSLITRSRNFLISSYYHLTKKNPFTHFMFLDSDVSADPRQVAQMIADMDIHEIDVIGAYVPLKEFKYPDSRQPDSYVHTYQDSPNHDLWIDKEKKLKVVDYLTTGMLIMRDHVVQELIRAAKRNKDWYYHELPNDDFMMAFDIFQCDLQWKLYNNKRKKLYLSEDWFLCETLAKLKYQIVLDTRVNVWHRGFYDYHFVS